jgi:hypothetical protein
MGRCGSCNRPLRDPQSIRLGYGPGCWARLGYAERTAVRASLAESAIDSPRPSPAERDTLVTATTPAPEPCPPERSDSALAVIAAWTVGLILVLALVLFWRWFLLGLGIVAATAVTGLLVEHVRERRLVLEQLRERGLPADGPPMLVRSVARERDEIAPSIGSRSVPTTPSGAL